MPVTAVADNVEIFYSEHGNGPTVLMLHGWTCDGTNLRPTLSFLAAILDRIGRYESAAIIAGFAVVSPLATMWTPELGTAITHLRDVLGEENHESLARKGETMTTAAMATYAYDQIDQARAELNTVSK
jgi:hypothetical protein